MSVQARNLGPAKTVGKTLVALTLALCFVLLRPITWVLAMMVVGLSCGACVSDLTLWPAAFCFAALVGVQLLFAFYPLESLDRDLGLKTRCD